MKFVNTSHQATKPKKCWIIKTIGDIIMKDFFGHTIAVGDKVAFSVPNYKDLHWGVVTKLTAQKVGIRYEWQSYERDTLQWPHNVIVKPVDIVIVHYNE